MKQLQWDLNIMKIFLQNDVEIQFISVYICF